MNKTAMYEYWNDYVKPKYGKNANLRYTDPDSFIFYVISKDIYADIAGDVKTRFDTSNYEVKRQPPIGKN